MSKTRIFFDNGNIEKILSDYIGVSQQYLEEELNNYLENEGSHLIQKDVLFNSGLAYKDILFKGCKIYKTEHNDKKEYEIIPISILDKTEENYNYIFMVYEP